VSVSEAILALDEFSPCLSKSPPSSNPSTRPDPACQTTLHLNLHGLTARAKKPAFRKNNVPSLTSMESLCGAQIWVREFFLILVTPILCNKSHVRKRGARNIESIVIVVAPHNRIISVASGSDALSPLHDTAVDSMQVLLALGDANVGDEAPFINVAVLGVLERCRVSQNICVVRMLRLTRLKRVVLSGFGTLTVSLRKMETPYSAWALASISSKSHPSRNFSSPLIVMTVPSMPTGWGTMLSSDRTILVRPELTATAYNQYVSHLCSMLLSGRSVQSMWRPNRRRQE
jgi:hypothetical protein